ncbi:MAG TPA: hypothetical protein VFT45_11560 [Longimicrobium sp.]|nr:hypothetical protein [Longimicrobium sp.]
MRKLLILPLLFAAACDGASGPSGSAQLSAADAAELSRAMFSMASGFASGGLPGGLGFDTAPMDQNTFTAPIHESAPCSPSGSTDIDGTLTLGFDDISMGMTLEADVAVTPNACAHRMQDGGIIKISGDPDLDVHLTLAGGAGDQLTGLKVTETGAFTWTRGGASGRCMVNLASLLDAPTQMVTVSGTFCGFPVSETFPLTEG